jgi:thymidylate synthase ThyX
MTKSYDPKVFTTKAGTRYLKEPGVALIAAPQFFPQQLTSFVNSYGDVFDAADYENDFYANRPGELGDNGMVLDDGAALVKAAGQLCYLSYGEKRSRNDHASAQKYFDNIMSSKHGSVLEHANFSFVIWGIDRACSHEGVRHRAGVAFCLAGDTEVWSGSMQKGRFDGVKRKWTIRDIFEKTKTSHGRSRIPLMRVRSFDGQFFVPNTITAVQESGRKAVYEMKLEDGRSVRCSADHTFLTDDGWQPLHTIDTSSKVATNGAHVWTPEMREHARQQKLGSNNHQWKGNEASQQAGRLRANRMFSVDGRVCSFCGRTDKLHRHHRDGNTLNNHDSNVEIICATCHQHEHHLGRRMTVRWMRVTSIKKLGTEMTYDIEVGAPHHNFVANGIVTHNSQMSQRYVDGKTLRFVEREEYQNDPVLHEMFEKHIDRAVEEYDARAEQLQRVMKSEHAGSLTPTERRKAVNSAARNALPNETETAMIMTGNVRAWRHVIEMRASKFADAPIRAQTLRIHTILNEVAPFFFGDFEHKEGDGKTWLEPKYSKV